MIENDDLSEAIAEAALGIDNQYVLKMKERDRKRDVIIKYKEIRRKEMAEQRLTDVLATKKQLEESIKADEYRKRKQLNYRVDDQLTHWPKRRMPLSMVDTNAMFDRNGGQRRVESNRQIRDEELNDENEDVFERIAKRQRFGRSNGVVIENLSPQSNEYSVSAICQTVGEIMSCCIELVNGQRRAKTYFVDPSDAHEFCLKFDSFKLDSSIIRTQLV